MSDPKAGIYASKLSRMIRMETVSSEHQKDKSKFYRFRELLAELFPHVFSVCELEDFDGSFLLHWKGEEEPILMMNHHDVVEASGKWSHAPFSGRIADGKVWGRGAADTKGSLCAILFAAEDNVSHRKHDAKRNDETVPTHLKLAKQCKGNFVQLRFRDAKTGERNNCFFQHNIFLSVRVPL